MQFTYLDIEQRSPEWLSARRGKVTASRLGDWLAVLKNGQPAQARLNYERELVFERQFGVNYNHYITPAMQEGIELEGFVRHELAQILKQDVLEVGCWHSSSFVASPDGLAKEAIVEIKVLKDNSFTDVLANGVPEAHMLQVQGGLLASGAKKAYYAAFNTTTKAIKVIEVQPDPGIQEDIERSLAEPMSAKAFDESNLYFIKSEDIPVVNLEDNPWTK